MVRRIFIISFMVLFILAGVTLAGTKADQTPTARQATPKPAAKQELTSQYKGKMEISDDVFDYGFLPRQSKVSHTFWLRNIGLDTLEVITIKPG